MQKALFTTIGLYLIVANLLGQSDANYKPRRLNKAIELLEDGQPIYYTNGASPQPNKHVGWLRLRA